MSKTTHFLAAILFTLLCSIHAGAQGPLPRTINVGPGQTYTSLTGNGGLFEAINTRGLSGNTIVCLTGDLPESGTHELTGAGFLSGQSLEFKLCETSAIGLKIYNISDLNVAMIRFNGVKNVTFAGSSRPAIINTNSNAANAKPAIQIYNNCDNVIIANFEIRTNCISSTDGSLRIGDGTNTNIGIFGIHFTNEVAVPNKPYNLIHAINAANVIHITNNTFSNFTGNAVYAVAGNGSAYNNNTGYQTSTVTTPIVFMNISGGGSQTIMSNIFGGNGSGGNMQINGVDFTAIQFTPNTHSINTSALSTVSGNTVEKIDQTGTGNSSIAGYRFSQGNINSSNNKVQHITDAGDGLLFAFVFSGVAGYIHNSTNDEVRNITKTNTGSSGRLVGIRNQAGGGTTNYINFNVFNLATHGSNLSGTSQVLTAMDIAPINSTINITGGKIYNVNASNNSAATTVAGINFAGSSSAYVVSQTAIRHCIGPRSYGVNIESGNTTIRNSQITMNMPPPANTFMEDIVAVRDNSGTTNTTTLQYNTFFLDGINSGSANSSCFKRLVTSTITGFSNAFYNNISGGTGNHVAISNIASTPATRWNAAAFDYNFLVATDPAKLGEWGTGGFKSFADWKSSSSGDNSSLTATPAQVPAGQFFIDAANGNLNINPANSTAWYANGNGIPISGITGDIDASGVRSDQVVNGATDIGADEFTPTSNPPEMTVTGSHSPGGTETFSFGGRNIAEIMWQPGGTLPTFTSAKFFPGTWPNNITNNGTAVDPRFFNFFTQIDATGGSGYSYNFKLYYTDALIGKVDPEADARLGMKPTGSGMWEQKPSSTNITLNFSSSFGALVHFSEFSGVDVNTFFPAPMHFRTKASGNWNDVNTWESSSDGSAWSTASSFPAFGSNTITVLNGHTVTVTSSVTIDETTVNSGGSIIINPAVVLTVNDGAGTDLNVISGGSVIVRSTAAGTGSIGNSAGTISNNFNVTVERYISDKRAWRLLGIPFSGSNQTIKAAWMEGAANSATNPAPGYGTHITTYSGDPNTANFDASKPGSSIRLYSGNNFNSDATHTPSTSLAITTNQTYFLFVRGNRSIDLNNAAAHSATTLRITGNPFSGNVSRGVTGTSFSLIPNPYPSHLDFDAIKAIAGNSTISTFYVWDASLGTVGQYRTVQITGSGPHYTYTATPGSANNNWRFIESGTAFFIPGNRTVEFTEATKTASIPPSSMLRTTAGNETELLINLYTVKSGNTATLADGVRTVFDNSYTPAIDNADAKKITGFEINLGIASNNEVLSIEKRPMPNQQDVIGLSLSNMAQGKYKFEIQPANFPATIMFAYLRDNYLDSYTPIRLTTATKIHFTISGDAASASPNRFSILFSEPAAVNNAKPAIVIYPNPVPNGILLLKINDQPKGVYILTILNSLGQVVEKKRLEHGGGSSSKTIYINKIKGIYMLEVRNPHNNKLTQKVVIN